MDSDEMLHRAILFSERAHRGQVRKGTDRPYFSHPAAVGMMVLSHGYGTDAAVVGLLHDVIEDTPVEREEVEEVFGPDIAAAVVDLSEPDKTQPWETRKRAYLDRIAGAVDLAVPACAADKIYNLKSILWDLDDERAAGRDPSEVWRRFKRPPWQIAGFHRAVHVALNGRGFAGPLMDALDRTVTQFALEVGADPRVGRFDV